jgi:hypothetical protein
MSVTQVKPHSLVAPRENDAAQCESPQHGWPLERVLFALAGTVTLVSAALAAAVSPWFLLLSAFVGVNQWLYVAFGACPSSIPLRRIFGLHSAIYEGPRREMSA